MTSSEAAWTLACACARVAAGESTRDGVLATADGISDWSGAIALASDQGLLPWLARTLHGAPIPQSASESIQLLAELAGARSLAQLQTLANITHAFERNGIATLPYKGPLLSMQLYGDVGLRQSTDLDVVVGRENFHAARRLLIANGFPSRHGHTVEREQLLFDWLGHATFGADEQFVELHWRFAPRQFPFVLTANDAHARAQHILVGGVRFPIMQASDLLVTLAMHGTRHLYERLEWLAGFWRLFRDSRPTIEELLPHATRLRARRMLLVSIALAERVLQAKVSEPWRAVIAADAHVPALAERMHRDMQAHGESGAPLPAGAELQREYSSLIDTRIDRLRSTFLAAMLPTEREWELVALPDSMLPVYRVLRPLRLVGLYARRVFRRDA